jgi:hypothetical protein
LQKNACKLPLDTTIKEMSLLVVFNLFELGINDVITTGFGFTDCFFTRLIRLTGLGSIGTFSQLA